MSAKKLTKEEIHSREESLEKLFNLIKLRIDTNATEIAIDKDKMGYLIHDINNNYAVDSFWVYFKEKYQVDNIEIFYNDIVEMMRDIYVRCLMPFNLELDIKYGNEPLAKEDVVTDIKRFIIWFKNVFQFFYINIIAFTVLVFTCYFSYYYASINEIWLSNLFLGASSSILAAIIITSINRHIRNILSKLEFQEKTIKEELLQYLNHLNEDVEKIKKNSNDDKSQFMLDFVDINNRLNEYLRSMEKFSQITTLEYFIELKKLEKKMFIKSSEIVNREVISRFEGLTKEEKSELTLQVFFLDISSGYYKIEVESCLYDLRCKHSRINKRII